MRLIGKVVLNKRNIFTVVNCEIVRIIYRQLLTFNTKLFELRGFILSIQNKKWIEIDEYLKNESLFYSKY